MGFESRLTDLDIRLFQTQLGAWFRLNARDLPWRRTHDPYCIWISEVMLQQTRVATVIDRYNQFVERFPSVVALALASEDQVLALWSGLGYYRRARSLFDAAQFLLREHDGSLPRKAAALRKLPGVGDYTAAAIASIAYGERVAVVDGNVERVLMRVLGLGDAGKVPSMGDLQGAANMLLDRRTPGAFNQAMMELGATVCLPQNPLCWSCPVRECCATRGEHVVHRRKQMKSRRTYHALLRKQVRGGKKTKFVLLTQRPSDAGLMPSMWELPLVQPESVPLEDPVLRIRHAITNTNYYVSVYEMDGSKHLALLEPGEREWTAVKKLAEIPLTGLARKILMRLDVMDKPRQLRTGKELPGAAEAFF